MSDNLNSNNNTIDNLLKLASICFDRHDKRREFEWKLNLSLWSAIGIILAYAFTRDFIPVDRPPSTSLWVAHSFVFVAYLYWTAGLYIRNKQDKEFGKRHLQDAEKHFPKEVAFHEKMTRIEKRKGWTPLWPHPMTVLVTLMLLATNLWVYLKMVKYSSSGESEHLTQEIGIGGMNTYEVISLILAFAGLIGLFVYVRKTVQIASSTSEHNDIITRPAVTVTLFVDDKRPWSLDHIWIFVQNHTAIHANMKILIEYEVKEALEDVTVKISAPLVTGDYNGEEEWNIAAKDGFFGHTDLAGLKNRQLKPNEMVILNIRVEVSPFDKSDYRPNPQRQYKWKSKTKEWVPYPVPRN